MCTFRKPVYLKDIRLLYMHSLCTIFLVWEYFLSVCHKNNYIKMTMFSKTNTKTKKKLSNTYIAVSVTFACVPTLRNPPPIVSLSESEHNKDT